MVNKILWEETMVKKISVMALAGLLALPTMSMAAGADVAELEKKIEELSRQLNELKGVIAAQAETVETLSDDVDDMDERSEKWDLISRFDLSGDFRSRLDWYNADTVFGRNIDNDTIWTNRFRLNMRVKATENVEFKGRLAMYKTWGNQSAFDDGTGTMFPLFDGNVTRSPTGSSALYVDRAFVNWNNIGGLPMWFSIGRRPTTDGPPAQIRMNMDDRQATPMAFMDWPFDGLSIGYAWNWGIEPLGSSRIRFCYGRGFEAGLQDDATDMVNDMDFAGLSWDIMKKGDRFAYIQSFMAFNLVNYPNFQDPIINANFGAMSGMGNRNNLGDVWHTSAVYQDKIAGLNYFVSGGYSKTLPDASGMFNDFLAPTPNTDSESGYSLYLGVRYDLPNTGLKFGAEFNHGSEFWLAMAPGHDDIYQSKLATRGQVYELYTIWDLPTGEKISKYAKSFIRLGYQHYEYDYAFSGNWNFAPYDLGDSATLNMLNGALPGGFDPVESADQIYLTFETYF